MDKSMILYRKKSRIVLNPEYIERVKKENLPLQNQAYALEPKIMPCRYCGRPAAVKYGDATGLLKVKCKHCNQEAVYDTADYRHYSYIAYPEAVSSLKFEYA